VGGEIHRLTITVVTKDPEDMPRTLLGELNDADTAMENLHMHLKLAVHQWFEDKGHEYVESEPEL